MKRVVRASWALIAVFALWACAGGQPAATPHPQGRDEPEPTTEQEAPPGEDCDGKTCAPPEQCIRYYGVAGPSIPLFTCGRPCGEQGECPGGMSCMAIADGPRLCR